MVATLLLAASLSSPPATAGHELTSALGYGSQGPILVASWTGRRRWGAWFRLDQPDGPQRQSSGPPSQTQVYTTAGSIGVGWRALARLTAGLGYGTREETTTVYGSTGLAVAERQNREGGLAAIATWTFPMNEILGVAVSASGGPGGFGAAAGVTFFFD